MRRFRIISLFLLFALFAAAPPLTARLSAPEGAVAVKADDNIPKPNFDFTNTKTIVNRWESLFVEGEKAGWKYTTVKSFKVKGKTNFLFEETLEANFDGKTVKTVRRAHTDARYMLVAFDFTEETEDFSTVSSACPHKGGLYLHHSVTDRRSGKPVRTKKVSGFEVRMRCPDFAKADIARLDRNIMRSSRLKTFNLRELREITYTCAHKKSQTVKIGKEDVSLDMLECTGDDGLAVRYYTDDELKGSVNGIRQCRYDRFPVKFETAEQTVAQAKDGKDAEYVKDENLRNNKYADKAAGIIFQRPHEAWTMRRTELSDNIVLVEFRGWLGMEKAYGFFVRSIPADMNPETVESCMRSMIESKSGGLLIAPEPGSAKTRGGRKYFEKDWNFKGSVTALKGKYYCLAGKERAMGLVMSMPGHVMKLKEPDIGVFLESIDLPLLEALPPTKFNHSKGFVTARDYHPSWTITENKNSTISATNDFLAVECYITGGEKDTTLSDVKRLKKYTLDLPKPSKDGVDFDSRLGGKKTIEAISYKGLGAKKMRYHTFIVYGGPADKYVYRIAFRMPAGNASKTAKIVRKFAEKLQLKMQ